MPWNMRLPQHVRDDVAALIRTGIGRNEIARRLGVSAGFVSRVARETGQYFPDDADTWRAKRAQQIDQWRQRERRLDELQAELFGITSINADGKPNRRYVTLSRQFDRLLAIHRELGEP